MLRGRVSAGQPGVHVGQVEAVDLALDAKRFEVTEKGVVLVTPDMLKALAG